MDASKINPVSEQLLVRYISSQTSDAETEQVLQWCKLNGENRIYLDQLIQTWEKSLTIAPDQLPNVEASLERLKNKVNREKRDNNFVRLISNRRWLSVAAVLICISIFTWFYTVLKSSQPDTDAIVQTFSRPGTFMLSDSSVITLNKNTRVKYDKQFDKDIRNISLEEGEAFFQVKPNPDKPFVVKVNKVTIKVLGTSFNVKSFKGNTEIIVETGKVQVSGSGEILNLVPDEKALVSAHSSGIQKQKNPDLLYQYYRTHEFIASNTPLWRMVEILNEAYGVHILISSERIKNLPLNITFKNESIDEILPVIAQTFNLTVQRKGDQILLK
jgi:transmembrane sensor